MISVSFERRRYKSFYKKIYVQSQEKLNGKRGYQFNNGVNFSAFFTNIVSTAFSEGDREPIPNVKVRDFSIRLK